MVRPYVHPPRLPSLAAALLLAIVMVLVPVGAASAATPTLARFPYLTDVTATSVDVVWSTSSADTSPGVVTYGPSGNCTQNVVGAALPATKYTAFSPAVTFYQHSVIISGLTPANTYCYSVYTGVSSPVTALLAVPPQFPTQFTTLPSPGSSSSFSFDVLGDFGETSVTNTAPLGTYNQYQDALDSQIAASAATGPNPALFAVSTGDVAYNSGSTTNYGDLNHPADAAGGSADMSNIFDARYWAKVGSSLPTFSVTGNHGRNSTFLSTWPEATNVNASAAATPGVAYGMTSYPAVDGQAAGNYPSDWYAFTVGGVRFYVLDADWTDLSQSTYPNLGTACPPAYGTCPTYQAERDEHWQQSSAEYQWLAADLARDNSARGASAMRMVFFHYPLRVDQNNFTTQQDVYLQNSAANPNGGSGSLEALLAANNVNMVFNGHAHMYERNIAPPGGVPNYVTGGGGAVLTNTASTANCSGTDAYARGWDPTHSVGSSCGTPTVGTAKPTAISQVFHFLKVTVNGTSISVSPTDSTGAVFDPVTFQFGADTSAPSVPGAPTAVKGTGASAANITLTLGTKSTDNVGVVAYDLYRDGSYRTSVPAAATKWTDVAVPPGTHTWTVAARDQRGNASGAGAASQAITLADMTAPSAPGAPVATTSVAVPDSVSLTWPAATDNVGVASYQLYRGGVLLQSGLTAPTATDGSVKDLTTYSYSVTATDAAGNVSLLSPATSVATPNWTPPPAPTLTATAAGPNEIDLSWTAATGATAYTVYRDGGRVTGGLALTAYADIGLSPGSTHSYTVTASDAAGLTSTPSNVATATVTVANTPVGPVTSLSAAGLTTAGQVSLTWSAPTNGSPSSYDVQRNGQVLQTGLTGTSFLDPAAPDSVSSIYTVVSHDVAGNSASASTSITPDWSAPTAPTGVSAAATSATTAAISFGSASDGVGVAGYTVGRTDSAGNTTTAASVAGSAPVSVTDTGLTPGGTYQYSVTASDAAGNVSSAAATTLVLPVFTESFESGALSPLVWTGTTGAVTVQQSTVHSGSWSAEELSTGAASYSVAKLPSTYHAVHAAAYVYIKSRGSGSSAGFFKLRSSTGAFIAYLYVNGSGMLSVRNDAGNVTHVSSTPVTTGAWHKVEMTLNQNIGGTISITAALDGNSVTFTTPVGISETLGSSAIGQLVLGDTVTSRTYDVAVDDISVDTQVH